MRLSSVCRFLSAAALAVACCAPLAAQQAITHYSSICVKVNPGREADFAGLLHGNIRKLQQSLADSGLITEWLALRAEIPMGKQARCDYLFVTFFPGLPAEPMSDEAFTAELHKAGLDMTPAQFWQPIMEDSYLVSNTVAEEVTRIGGIKVGDYVVDNSMKMPDVSECIATEQKLWEPFAEARISAGKQSGWRIWVTTYPRGSMVKDSAGTVDIYPTWDSIFNTGSEWMDTWDKVHPNVKPADAMAQFDKQCRITRSIVYKDVDDVRAATE